MKTETLDITKKCSRAKPFWCQAMERFASDVYDGGRRIFISPVIEMETGKTKKPRVAYQYGRKRSEFMWLLWCPWCGGDLASETAPRKRRKAKP